jgi:DNA-binding MarR family transcriptional regulator
MIADNETHQILFKFNLAQRTLMKSIDRDMREKIGATATQMAALFYLMDNDGCLLVDLSRELLQNKSAITTLVERMEKNCLLQKVPSQVDKRASQLFLTTKGRELGLKALPFVAAYDNVLADGFSLDELAVVSRFLDTVISRFETVPDNYFKKGNPFSGH